MMADYNTKQQKQQHETELYRFCTNTPSNYLMNSAFEESNGSLGSMAYCDIPDEIKKDINRQHEFQCSDSSLTYTDEAIQPHHDNSNKLNSSLLRRPVKSLKKQRHREEEKATALLEFLIDDMELSPFGTRDSFRVKKQKSANPMGSRAA
jgi:hypothetical protein